MKIIQKIERKIDSNDDGIKFELNLYNEGKYDCDELRTIIRNVGIRLGITNNLKHEIIINNLYLGIEVGNKLSYYYSTSVRSKFPFNLKSKEKICVNFYGSDIRNKFARHKNETGVFILCIANYKNFIKSSKFNGDKIEKFITELEDGEEANWGSKDHHRLDHEVSEIHN